MGPTSVFPEGKSPLASAIPGYQGECLKGIARERRIRNWNLTGMFTERQDGLFSRNWTVGQAEFLFDWKSRSKSST